MGKQNKNKNSNMRRGTQKIPRLAYSTNLVYGFPPQMMTRLRYVDTYALQSTSGSIGKQLMNLNSTFDPDATGVGHQPLYRDTYAAIYDQYAVIACRARVKFTNTNTADNVGIGIVVDDDSTTSTTITTLCEQNYGQHTILPPLAGSLSTHTFTHHWDCKRDLGIDPFTSQTYKTAVGSNPSELATLLIWAANLAGNTASYACQVELEYDVLWTELTSPTQS